MELRIAVLLALLVGVYVEVRAAEVMKDDKGNAITLHQGPCLSAEGVLEKLPQHMRVQMKAARVRWQGKDYDACWLLLDQHTVYILDSAGDQRPLDRRQFKKEPEA